MRKPGAPVATTSPVPFLTEDQRVALDAALAAKKEEAAKSVKANHQKAKEGGAVAGERKSRNSKGTGGVKKAGGGGKFTWGNLLTDMYGAPAMDSHDPNYDSDEDRQVVYTTRQDKFRADVQAYKQQLLAIAEEYFSSADAGAVAEELQELDMEASAFYFVKTLIRLAVDRKDREREMASSLLSQLYGEVISPDQMQKGFSSLMESLEDLKLDVPNAADLLGTFAARAVVDEILPPAFVAKVPAAEGSATAEAKHKAESALAARHGAERLQRCWGTDAHASYADTKAAITKLLAEFATSHDADEASRCLNSLSAPFFHHEVVKQAVNMAMETPTQASHLIELLTKLSASGEISSGQVEAGFARVRDNLGDTALDCPNAPEAYGKVVEAACTSGLLPADFKDGPLAASPHSPAATNGSADHSVAGFKAAAITAVKEYFSSQDVEEVSRRLEELDEAGLHHLLVQHAIRLAMDRKDRERELVSTLLSSLVPTPIASEQLAGGILRVLLAAEDMVLDHPDAVHTLALFIGRAVVDEALPPSFLTSVLKSLQPGSLGVAVVQQAGSILSSRHAAERLLNCWHGGGLSLELVRARMKDALLEYFTSKDADEAAKCLLELEVPHYHHEAVKTAVELTFEDPTRQEALQKLLQRLVATGEVSDTQMAQGLNRVGARLDDYKLDYPSAAQQLGSLLKAGKDAGWLPAGVEAEVAA